MGEVGFNSHDALSKGVKEYYKEFRVFDEKYPHEWTAFNHPELVDTGYQIQKTTPKSGGYVPHNDSRSEFIGDLAQTRHIDIHLVSKRC